MRSEFKIAEQINGVGVYAYIALNVSELLIDSSKNLEITFSESALHPAWNNYEWYGAIIFGASYFLEHSEFSKLKIEILEIDTNPVDTSNIIVAYTTIMAICNGLNTKLKRMPIFDKETISFSIPK